MRGWIIQLPGVPTRSACAIRFALIKTAEGIEKIAPFVARSTEFSRLFSCETEGFFWRLASFAR